MHGRLVPYAWPRGLSSSAVSGSFTTSLIFERMKSQITSLASRLVPTSMNVAPMARSSPFCHDFSSIANASSRDTASAETVGISIGTPADDRRASASYALRSALSRATRSAGCGPLKAGIE